MGERQTQDAAHTLGGGKLLRKGEVKLLQVIRAHSWPCQLPTRVLERLPRVAGANQFVRIHEGPDWTDVGPEMLGYGI